MTIGVACATFPTSSSFCIIFFIRATGNFVCLFLFFMGGIKEGHIIVTTIGTLVYNYLVFAFQGPASESEQPPGH